MTSAEEAGAIRFALPARSGAWAAGLSALVFLSGCGILGGGKEAPQGGIEKVATPQVESMKAGEEATKLVLAAKDRLNTCGGEQSNILVVRVYQLKSDGALVGASLSQIWDHEGDELKADLLEQAEFVLEPGQQQEVSISSKSSATVLAVVADFCSTDGDCWRWIRPWKSVGDSKKLVFGESCIEEAK